MCKTHSLQDVAVLRMGFIPDSLERRDTPGRWCPSWAPPPKMVLWSPGDEEDDDKGEATSQIEGVLTKDRPVFDRSVQVEKLKLEKFVRSHF